MKVYVVMSHYSDYDEGQDEVLGVYATEIKAIEWMCYFDMACELDYLHPGDKFLWGSYDNYAYSITEMNVEY